MSQSNRTDANHPIQEATSAGYTGGPHAFDPPSKRAVWSGYFLSGFAILFLTFDTVIKLLQAQVAVEGTTVLGYPASTIVYIGLIELVCLIVYLIPRSSVLGAILWTGYLGGAIATHVRVQNPLFSHVLFPTYVAAMLWGGLWLRDRRLRDLLPIITRR
jgi:hypothetical protein